MLSAYLLYDILTILPGLSTVTVVASVARCEYSTVQSIPVIIILSMT